MAKNSKSFTFASQYLNEEQKRSVAALYAYCRYADDIADEVWLPNKIKDHKLKKLEKQIENIEYLEFEGNPIMYALKDTVLKYNIPKEYLLELIKGVRMDFEINDYDTVEQLNLYCYRVASVVGIMMCYIFGSTSDEALARAADLGIAMQITNILRDIARDFEMGRIYLPKELRDKHGVSVDDLALKQESGQLIELIKAEIIRARNYYSLGEQGIIYLPDGADFTIKVASSVYSAILNQIEDMEYNILTNRAVVPKYKKMWIAAKLKLKRMYFRLPFSTWSRGAEPA
jgi:phytoene synthase